MLLSGLLGGQPHPGSRSIKDKQNTCAAIHPPGPTALPHHRPPGYIADDSQLAPIADDPPDLRELNACIEALASVFPDVQIEVFREMLGSFDGESRLFVVADALLKNRIVWVKGRWKVPDKKPRSDVVDQEPTAALVRRAEVFRNPEYKQAVRSIIWQEFKGFSKSTINAVLAENNYDYLPSRAELIRLSQKSWRFTISSLLLRRRNPAEEAKDTAALVHWRSMGKGSIEPTLKTTGNAELDRELFQAIILPLRNQERSKQVSKDLELAIKVNTDEAEKHGSLFECNCCYADVTFEELCSCTGDEGHAICFRCVQHCVSEAVFGQGWRSIDGSRGTLRCPAVGWERCLGLIPRDQLCRAVTSQEDGANIILRLDHRLADMSLASSGLPLVRCPFCDYAEIDDIYLPSARNTVRVKTQLLTLLLPAVAIAFRTLPILVVFAILLLILAIFTTPIHVSTTFSASPPNLNGDSEKPSHRVRLTEMPSRILIEFRSSVARHLRRRRGLRFTCLGQGCGVTSCLSCRKEWIDIHVCNESSLIKLRTKVEQAMSLAVKRVCPRCNMSFIKSSGCNKLTCPCGYKMCYVCRKDIGAGEEEGYRHFCDHFRPEGDGSRCAHCDRCNLWETEDTEAVLARAKERAEKDWSEQEGRDLRRDERRVLDTGMPGKGKRTVGGFASGRRPSLRELCDLIVENILV